METFFLAIQETGQLLFVHQKNMAHFYTVKANNALLL
jgi:hypothetical protein